MVEVHGGLLVGVVGTGGFEGSEEVTSLECSLQLEVLKRYWTARP
ncbi:MULTISPECIES: hypothetical protein [unclassified Streptomyces]|nr:MULTISPECIES: hypothetical protein [unclassified Streptomyces]